jgi:hypothetical protein
MLILVSTHKYLDALAERVMQVEVTATRTWI